MPNAGDFGLVSIPGGMGRLIRVGQWLNGDGYANYEHAFLHIGNGQIIEARPGGAKIRLETAYDDRIVRWSTGVIVPKDPEKIAAIGRSFETVPYSAADYFAIATRRLHLWPADVALKRFVASTRRMICSQLIAAAYRLAGEDLFPHEWPGYCTPGQLAGLLNAKEKETV